jgi:hypothetical protein
MIDFNKTSFDNSFNTIFMLQEQTERTVNMFLEHAIWPTEEGKKVLREWVKAYNKGCDDFKQLVDANFKHVDAFFADVKKTEAVKPEAAKPEAVKPEAVKPEAVEPKAEKPEVKKADARKAETKKARKTKPK